MKKATKRDKIVEAVTYDFCFKFSRDSKKQVKCMLEKTGIPNVHALDDALRNLRKQHRLAKCSKHDYTLSKKSLRAYYDSIRQYTIS